MSELVAWRKMKREEAIKNNQDPSKYENLELAIMFMNDDKEFVRLRNKSMISFLEEKYSSKYVTTYNLTYFNDSSVDSTFIFVHS